MATVAAIAGVASLVIANEERQRQRRAVRRQNKAQRRLDAIANSRSRRKAAAEARRARSAVAAEAAGSGALGSSAVSGALSSISSQAASNIGFSRIQVQIGEEIRGFASDANRAGTNAANASAIGSLPQTLGLSTDLSSVFDTTPTTVTPVSPVPTAPPISTVGVA